MKSKLLGMLAGVVALAAMSLPANAVIISNFGINPTSAGGFFSNDPVDAPATFYDQYTFQLLGTSFVAVTSATNTFATGIGSSFYIANFTGAIYSIVGGIDLAPGVPVGGADQLVFGPQLATLCVSLLCQTLDGVGILPAGNYYLALAGLAGADAGYGGNFSVTPLNEVPLPGAVWLMGSILGAVFGGKKLRDFSKRVAMRRKAAFA